MERLGIAKIQTWTCPYSVGVSGLDQDKQGRQAFATDDPALLKECWAQLRGEGRTGPLFVVARFERREGPFEGGRRGGKDFYACQLLPYDRMVVHVGKAPMGYAVRVWQNGEASEWKTVSPAYLRLSDLVEAQSEAGDYYGLVKIGAELKVKEVIENFR